jgi:geranylgeranyl pyrophosphate synthase
MNDPVLAEPAPSVLAKLLGAHFSEAALTELLGPASAALGDELWNRALRAPVLDVIDRPSKALRAGLVARCFELAGGRGQCPDELSAIVEVLHAGSLVIDDIEDCSTLRRGRPALHTLHGVPVALNAGNWMYFWALGLVEQLGLSERVQLSVYRWLHRTLLRSHHGQGLDLTANVYRLAQAEVAAVVLATTELKTGALMELSAALGALAADAEPSLTQALTRFGRELGIALQMLDDVGGLVSEKRCHKGHEDLRLGRPTWPWAWLSADLTAARHTELMALGAEVSEGKLHPEVLARLMRGHLRGSSRVRVRRYLHAAFARLEAETGLGGAALTGLRAELDRLEKSYG